ncbi:YciI family protein [Ornithinimicrobium faecis]|uniref:YciI family protein n=1 Tax=Ornithinimicrobium faecis TaxID=2934158 RepID=A0ABY4YSX9_9MICO|nr:MULTISPECIES: YciI family protein [unclassified Ornithinimicrobium]USQ79884.1 YciI family protein [Ornithinimicrobium sp. HY1793]
MSLYAVRYTYSDDVAGRDEHRPAHREFLSGLAEEGTVVASGPLSDAPAEALLLLEGESAEQVRDLLREDPFAQQGIIDAVEVREWDVVIGSVG